MSFWNRKNKKTVKKEGGGISRHRVGSVAKLLCAALALNSFALTLTACGGKDELGNKYAEKTEDRAAADALVLDAKTKSDAIADISYDIALMVRAEYGDKVFNLGVKNSYFATDRGTEESEIFCTKTYYGAEGNQVDAYYRHGGYLYIDFCNTMIRSQVSEKDFYTHIAEKGNTASTDFFKGENFSDACVYEYRDGGSAAVYSAPSDSLLKSISVFLGLEGNYMYDFSQVYLRCNVKADGTVSDCRLDFKLDYYDAMSPDAVVTYDGEFACTVNGTGEGVTVRAPQTGVEYATVSDFSKLELLTGAYDVLSSFTSVSADYYRKVVNEDYLGNKYQLENEATFTQTYKDKVYNYGSIDVERGSVVKVDSDGEKTEENTLTSVGIFVDGDGKYHYRDLEDNDEDKDNEQSIEQWILLFSATMSEEAFFEDDLSSLQISEDGEYITFTYEYSSDAVPVYAVYLLEAFAGQQGSVNIGNQTVTPSRNKGVVKVRVSDGCLVYHKIEFEALIGYTVKVSGDFTLTVNAVGEGVEVLDTEDWVKHEMRFN